jgi:hypothetical protein
MAKTTPRIKDIGQNLSAISDPVVVLSKIDAPFTTVVNRAKMVDLSNDLGVRMGIERISISPYTRVDGETGPNGEIVYKMANDKFDQIRLVGRWSDKIENSTVGQAASGNSSADYVEVTFYGTGLNLLQTYQDGISRNFSISIDGGSETTLTSVGSSIISNRNYNANIVRNVASGLSLGLHTIKIRQSSGISANFCGFEILNTASSLQITAGTALINGTAASLSSTASSAYNSGFESGTLGTRGGRVLVYTKNDGTIGKAVTPTDASQLNLTSASHANEEVIRSYFWREFGAGRTDDFGTMTGSSQRAFTLDDGTTSLSCSSGCSVGNEALILNNNGEHATFTFVGTGVDLYRYDNAPGGTDTYAAIIDGVSVGNLATAGVTNLRVEKLVSGLPYGTHTIKISRTAAATYSLGIRGFVVYGPKKPTLPVGTAELADYNVMANYAQISSLSGLTDKEKVSAGVLRKASVREFIYSGTWNYTLDISMTSGGNVYGNTASNYAELTFFGTAVDLRLFMNTSANNYTISIDGVTNLTGAGYTTNLVQGSTGLTFVGSTGVLSGTSAANTQVSASVSGIPLGVHKLRITFNSGNQLQIDCVDVATPIHTHMNNGPFTLQNTLAIGSQGVKDSRRFGDQLVVPNSISQAFKMSSNPTSTSTTYVPISEHAVAIRTYGNPIEITHTTNGYVVSSSLVFNTQLYLNGEAISQEREVSGTSAGGASQFTSDSVIVPVAAGWHYVQLFMKSPTGSTISATNRNIRVVELKG